MAGKVVDSVGNAMAEKSFVSASINSAQLDKQSFFGGDFVEHSGLWPEHMDRQYMNFAIEEVAPKLLKRQEVIIRIAYALESQGFLENAEIEGLLGDIPLRL